MSGMPRPNPKTPDLGFIIPSREGPPVVVGSMSEGWAETKLRYRQLKDSVSVQKSARINLGVALIELRKRTDFGQWRSELDRHGVHRNTAWRSMRDAADRLVEEGRMTEADKKELLREREKRPVVPGGTTLYQKPNGAGGGGGDMGGYELPEGVSLDLIEDELAEEGGEGLAQPSPLRLVADGASDSVTTAPRRGDPVAGAPGSEGRGGGFRAGGVGGGEPTTQRTAGAGSSRDEIGAKGRRQDVAGQLPMSRLYDAIDGVLAGLERVRNADLSGVGGAARSRLMELLGLVSRGIDEVLSPFSSSSCDGPGSNDPGSSSPVAAGV